MDGGGCHIAFYDENERHLKKRGANLKKVIDIEERIPSMRERRRRRASRKFIFIVAIFLIALLLIFYFQSSMSKVGKLVVNGASIHEPSVYSKESGIQEGEGLWGFKKSKAENKLKEIEGVREVKVSRSWLRDVTIDLTEWRPIAYVEEEGQYGLLLENGEVFMPVKLSPEEDAPILSGFKNEKVQSELANQLKKMENDVYQLISEIIYSGNDTNPNQIIVFMDDGYEVQALIPTFAEKMIYYPQITAQLTDGEKGVIDMEVGTFFTPYSQIYGLEEVFTEEGEDEDE